MAKEQQKQSTDNRRLAQAKRKLDRLNNEFEQHAKKVTGHTQQTNGQPMNDKRGGDAWSNEQARLDEKSQALLEEIQQQEERVNTLARQAELKANGYNKYGGLEMTIDNIPRIKEELERAAKGESKFSNGTIKKYEQRLAALEQLQEKAVKGSENSRPEVQALIDSGRVTQWKKNPTIYFVKGYRKVALELNENGLFEASKKYQATTEEEKAVVNELLAQTGSEGVPKKEPEVNKQAATPQAEKESPKEVPSKAEQAPVTQPRYHKRTAEEIRNEVNALSKQALDAVKKHTNSPEDVKELLDFMSRFPERSFRNQVLIEQQYPGARACLGQAALKKQGIYIKKGEKGNSIFVRKTVRGFYTKERGFVREKEATPSEKKQIESGQLKIEQKPYYTIEKVFDVTQTHLKPEDYPKIFPNRVFDFELDDKGQKELQAGIQAVAHSLNIEINDMREGKTYHQELGQARGAYVQNEQTGEEEIVLNSRNTATQNLATSIHELAHAKMHKFSELDTPTKELQAELTSYIVCKHFGMDTSEKAIPYISAWTNNGQTLEDKEVAARGKIMNDVSRVANEFIRTISTEINHRRERGLEIQQPDVKQEPKERVKTVETTEPKRVLPIGSLWIDKKNGHVLEEDTGRTLHLKEAAFVEDPKNGQVILTGKSYGEEIQTTLSSEEFALGVQFQFPKEVVEAGNQRKQAIYQEQQLKQVERN